MFQHATIEEAVFYVVCATQQYKLPLQHKISNIGMICSVKPVLTRELVYSAKGTHFQ
jgi:hypothetical protein